MTDITVSIGGDDVNVTIEGGSLQPSLQIVQDSAAQAAASAAAALGSENAAAASAASAAASAALSGSGSATAAAASAVAAAASAALSSASATTASAAATEALGSATAAAGSAASSSASAVAAASSATAAQQAALAGRLYPTATANVPRGLDVATIASAGTGYTNGVYDIATTGGSLTIQGVVRVTVAGGVITAAVVTQRGQYIGASPSAPTVPLAALGGGSGGSVTVTLGFLVGSGETYLANHASDTTLYQLYNNNSGSPAIVSGATVPKNYNQIYQTRQFVPLAYVSGSSSANYTVRPIDTNTVLSGFGTQYVFGLQLPFGLNGNHNIAILNGDGSPYLPLTLVEAPKGGIEAAGAFQQYDYINIVRNPSPIGSNPGTANNLRRLAPPNAALTTLSEEFQTYALQKPSWDKEVSLQIIAERVMLMRTRGVQYDDPMLEMDSDEHQITFYNLGRAMSLATPQCAVAWAVNSHRGIINGQTIDYSSFLSNEGAGANFDREGPSIMEPVCRTGLLTGTTLATTIEVGNGHGGLGNTAADLTIELYDAVSFNGATAAFVAGDVVTGLSSGSTGTVYRSDLYSGSYGALNGVGSVHMKVRSGAFTPGEALRVAGVTKAFAVTSGYRSVNTTTGMSVGTIYNCSEVLMRHRYDGYYSYVSDARFGEVIFTHRINVDGLTMCDREPIYRVGRRLNFDAGSGAITVGQTVTGATSGATGIVRSIPDLGATGTFGGGNRAGSMFLDAVTGTWQDNESIQVGGVTKATVNGTLGPVVGVINSYSALLSSTTVNRAKIAGFNQIAVGYANGVQRPNAADNYPPFTGGSGFTGTWPVGGVYGNGSPMQLWHSRNEQAGMTPILQMKYSGVPMTPPGDFSLAQTSKLQIEDRFGGNRKFSINWVSGDAVAFTGNYTSPAITHQFRVGDPI